MDHDIILDWLVWSLSGCDVTTNLLGAGGGWMWAIMRYIQPAKLIWYLPMETTEVWGMSHIQKSGSLLHVHILGNHNDDLIQLLMMFDHLNSTQLSLTITNHGHWWLVTTGACSKTWCSSGPRAEFQRLSLTVGGQRHGELITWKIEAGYIHDFCCCWWLNRFCNQEGWWCWIPTASVIADMRMVDGDWWRHSSRSCWYKK